MPHVRSCHLHYFISDDTMGISEAREENSGMPQGTFLKRTKVPNPAGGFYALRDIGCARTRAGPSGTAGHR